MTLPELAHPNAAPPLDDTRDDRRMLRVAAAVVRDLSTPRASVYWPDLLISTGVGYTALAGAISFDTVSLALASGLVAILALYRAASFIHELSHLRKGALPGFRFAWNALIGIPLMIPSFLYEGVHTQHHARTRYGTAEDPEYLSLALMKPWSLPLFVMSAALAPLALIVRFGVLTPMGVAIPPLRKIVQERCSALSINPAYRRSAPHGAFRRQWQLQEACACLWALMLAASVVMIGTRPLLTYLAVHSGLTVLNQLRTLVAHLWENDGEVMSVTEQYLDSVNVPPPNWLAPIWAPLGLRYHALHHLLPSLPYHSLGTAHRRIMAQIVEPSAYRKANHSGMLPLIARIARGTASER
ncbi:fatty acid desaturase (plasmid) [Sphingomonas panacis]|uniref:Fatty acid desaturase n=1 Tax=Sphingomonas panacis TaxID=1560345 RepID=A0A1B3ZIQ1_9SPHN|nr:fatty acid desaturase [Sphingomonas panacis]